MLRKLVDNTNPEVHTRKYYLDICKEHKVPARSGCFHFGSWGFLCKAENFLRASGVSFLPVRSIWHGTTIFIGLIISLLPLLPKKWVLCTPFLSNHINWLGLFFNLTLIFQSGRALVPYAAFARFRDHFEEPTLKEGFTEIKKVNWVFEGTEEERKYWSMWLQVDGK